MKFMDELLPSYWQVRNMRFLWALMRRRNWVASWPPGILEWKCLVPIGSMLVSCACICKLTLITKSLVVTGTVMWPWMDVLGRGDNRTAGKKRTAWGTMPWSWRKIANWSCNMWFGTRCCIMSEHHKVTSRKPISQWSGAKRTVIRRWRTSNQRCTFLIPALPDWS